MTRVVNVAEIAADDWRFVADDIPATDWQFHSSAPKNAIERLIRRPNIARYRAAIAAAKDARFASVVVSHMPVITAVTAMAMKQTHAKARHLAVSFNFTSLPTSVRLRIMKQAIRGVDRFLVYSRAEQRLYPDLFELEPERFDFMHWPMAVPAGDQPPLVEGPYICAAGGEGRDYGTLVKAMRGLSDIPLVIVARPGLVDTSDLPPNVRVLTNIPVEQFWTVVKHSTISVLPLRDAETNCGHITLTGSMLLGRSVVATRSSGIADYVTDLETGWLCHPRDPDALAHGIRTVWDDESLRAVLAERGHAFATVACNEANMRRYVADYIAADLPPSR
jgi:glycosyltransferase involved in cell wall biosynthesis